MGRSSAEAAAEDLAVTFAEAEASPRSGVVAQTCAILRLLSRSETPMGVNAIARQLSMAPSSCFKILKGLHAEAFVECEERSKAYSLGLAVATLSRRALDPANAFAVLRRSLERIAREQSIAIGLWGVRGNHRIVLVGFCEGGTPMRIHMTMGQRLPRLMGAVGRAIAADLGLTCDEMRAEFDAMEWQAAPSFEEYVADVERARAAGYALDAGRFAPGVCSVATTIKDEAGEIHYGVTGIMFDGQHDQATIETIAAALVSFSKAAAQRLGLVSA